MDQLANYSEYGQISEFGRIFIFLCGGVIFVLGGFLSAKLISPSRPNPEKLTSYECGEDPIGSSWIQFNLRFYVVALIFILFDVEIVFIFPWATVFGNENLINATHGLWGWFSIIEMFIFIGILLLGLAYVWVKGDLDWVKPKLIKSDFASEIPSSVYEEINNQKINIKKEINETEPVTQQ